MTALSSDTTPLLCGIAGGIGSGKSIFSRLLRMRGYKVFDCDYEAKLLMQSDAQIRASIEKEFGGVHVLGNKEFARKVFHNPEMLLKLNAIVHPAVKLRLIEWAEEPSERNIKFVESAILASSGIAEQCDAVCRIITPHEQCIRNVVCRSQLNRQEIFSRIEAQAEETSLLEDLKVDCYPIYNNSERSLLQQADTLIEILESYNQHLPKC